MDTWLQGFENTIKENNIEIFLLRKYVDDVLLICENLPLGSRWMEGKITHSAEAEQEDLGQNRTVEQVTMTVMKDVADSQIAFLKFTGEHSEGETKKVPVLDSKLWYGKPEAKEKWFQMESTNTEEVPGQDWSETEDTILYSFYSKPMSNKLTMLRRSAVPESTKVSTMSSEILRRWKCTSEGVGAPDFRRITVEYIDSLTAMGYSLEWRKKVVSSTLKGYMRILAFAKQGHSDRNRFGASTFKKRRFNRTIGKQEWFRPHLEDEEIETVKVKGGRSGKAKDQDKYIESILFVPHTPEGMLRSRLLKLEHNLGFENRYKYVEEQGRILSQMFVRKDPTPTGCERDLCFPCRDTPGKCMRQGGVYKITCLTCTDKVSVYFGETARTLHDRGLEHPKALNRRSDETPLWEHHQIEHQGQEIAFKMK